MKYETVVYGERQSPSRGHTLERGHLEPSPRNHLSPVHPSARFPFPNPFLTLYALTYPLTELSTPSLCGTDGLSGLAPDFFPYTCFEHDLCYGYLETTQQECDNQFLRNALKESPHLAGLAHAYFLALRLAGDDAYERAQREAKERERRRKSSLP